MDGKDRISFGTDGIRGRANTPPMTAEAALRVGMAAGLHFRRNHSDKHRVVIGKDTRRSGYMLENALTAGLTATGMNVLLLGPVPTPAVGLLTRSMRADLGIMISASHNPYFDNGIKLFGPDGYKLSEMTEKKIESICNGNVASIDPEHIGRAKRIDDGLGRYVEFAKTTFPKTLRLNGLRVVVDCANGAAYRAAPEVLWELGGEVLPVAVDPDGHNINFGCGTTDPHQAVAKVLETRADVGICLDGDADRLVVIDQTGSVVDGDQLLALLAERWLVKKRLKKNTLVTTIMSNYGMEQYLNGVGIKVERTAVGDRFVTEAMRRGGFKLGGEPSGHIVMSDYTTTGDGLIAALQFLATMVESEVSAHEMTRIFDPLPQTLINVPFRKGKRPLRDRQVRAAMREGESRLKGNGRLVVRESGTEPVVRIMVESNDESKMRLAANELAAAIADAA
ncbi:MAG: phosphoglucosamine mutase [Rhodobacteraceae bacterium]|nr:phosphoglucosamine mutase [Paracoccaceae bacterium]MCY4196122.1 phosphoglucosamine mutase [Paracoccaceae bacterium]